MSNRELCYRMIDQFPEDQLFSVINILESLCDMSGIPAMKPNEETAAAMREVEVMTETGSGEHFAGSTADFFAMLNEDEPC